MNFSCCRWETRDLEKSPFLPPKTRGQNTSHNTIFFSLFCPIGLIEIKCFYIKIRCSVSLLSVSFLGWNSKLPFGFCFHIPCCHPILSGYQKVQFFSILQIFPVASQVVLVVNNPSDNARNIRDRIDLWVGQNPWRRVWQPTPVFLSGKSHWQRILRGYHPWCRKRVGHGWSDSALTHVKVFRSMYTVQFLFLAWKFSIDKTNPEKRIFLRSFSRLWLAPWGFCRLNQSHFWILSLYYSLDLPIQSPLC